MSFQVWMFRRNCKKSDGKRDAGLTTPAEIERFDNIVYGKDAKWQSMDIYRPKSAEGALPVIVSLHGGGWVYGDKELYQYYCMDLAKRGFVVVNFTYRLAPKFKYPAPIEDANLVFHWIVQHSEAYGMDLNHLYAVGDSAGAANLSIYASILTNPAYAAKYPSIRVPEGLSLKALGLNCGVYTTDPNNSSPFMKALMPKKGTPEELALLHIVDYITPAFPPSFVLTANKDFLVEDAEKLVKVLQENNIAYEHKVYGDEEHPLYHVFHCDMKSDAATLANDEECAFFKKYL